ncbi:hypothetical protein BpHYR1_003917 [Brachionus plicatilis]|uniref:Uncharacterized protein n=1 Tax=Brachionus plicatilis TaxID=10195 RepID=A0A3M7RER6_BRAPC|nr:hypothetical protein BpHYR1_003917 [Brachionus plicatilis]
MHVNNSNSNKKCRTEDRNPAIIPNILKFPDVFRKGMDDHENGFVFLRLVVPQAALTQSISNWTKLNEYKQRQNHLIDYVDCKNNGFDKNSSTVAMYTKNNLYTSETDYNGKQKTTENNMNPNQKGSYQQQSYNAQYNPYNLWYCFFKKICYFTGSHNEEC